MSDESMSADMAVKLPEGVESESHADVRRHVAGGAEG
jgi:hypothetical protein